MELRKEKTHKTGGRTSAGRTIRSDWRTETAPGDANHLSAIFRCSMVALAKFAIAVWKRTQRSTSLRALVNFSKEMFVLRVNSARVSSDPLRRPVIGG